MANPKLPGIPEAEQALLYAKLNEYNGGRDVLQRGRSLLCGSAETGTSHLFGLGLLSLT